MKRKARMYAHRKESKAFWKGYCIATLIMLLLHFLWIWKGMC